MDPDQMSEQTRNSKYCPDHDLMKFKDSLGRFVCPFCEADYE